MLSTPANWIWSTRGLPFRNGGVGLVSQRAGPEFSLLAVVAGCRFLHSSPADRLERSDNHLPAGDCVAYTCGSRRPLQPRLGQPVGYSGTLSPGLGRTRQGDHYANGNTYYSDKLDVDVGN